jgi:hypothetical protein
VKPLYLSYLFLVIFSVLVLAAVLFPEAWVAFYVHLATAWLNSRGVQTPHLCLRWPQEIRPRVNTAGLGALGSLTD